MKNKKYIVFIISITILIFILGIYFYHNKQNKNIIISEKVSKVAITVPNNSDDNTLNNESSEFIYDKETIEYLTNIVNKVGDEYTEFYQNASDYGEECTYVDFYLENGEKIQIATSDFYSEKEDGTKFNIILVSFLDDWSADDYSNYKVYETELNLASKIQQCYK